VAYCAGALSHVAQDALVAIKGGKK